MVKQVPFPDYEIEAKNAFYSPASLGFAPQLRCETPAPERASRFCTEAESASSEMPRRIEVAARCSEFAGNVTIIAMCPPWF